MPEQQMSRLPFLLLTVVPLLGACSNAPEQPSDVSERERELSSLSEDITNADSEPDVDFRLSEIPATERDYVAQTDVFGSWARDEAECTAAAGPPVTISSGRYEDLAGSCEINELVDNGDGFTASLSCERDGAKEAQLLKLTPDGDTLALSWVARDDPDRTLVRCEE